LILSLITVEFSLDLHISFSYDLSIENCQLFLFLFSGYLMCILEEKLDEMTLARLEDFEYVASSFSIKCLSHPIAQ